MNRRHVVLGIGNILNRDEGLGVRALDLLEEQVGLFADVEYVDGGVMGLSLLPLVEECEHLLILDAVDAGAAPGGLIEMSDSDIRLFTGVKMSEHQVTFQEVLGLAFIRGKLPPHLHLIGAQPISRSGSRLPNRSGPRCRTSSCGPQRYCATGDS